MEEDIFVDVREKEEQQMGKILEGALRFANVLGQTLVQQEYIISSCFLIPSVKVF